MDFLRFLTRRILYGVLVLWLITLATFALFFIAPPDVARSLAGKGATPAQVTGIRHRLGLDQPLIVQYWHYLDNLLHGNLGTSYFSGAPVSSMLKADLPPTLSLIIGGAILWIIAGIGFGVLSATRARSLLDRVTTTGVLIGYSMPTFVLGGLLLFVFFFRLGIPWLQPGYYPITQSPITWLGRMILPWITLALVTSATYTRLTRSSMLEVLGEDYVRTARSKGMSENRLITRHALRAALTPVVTLAGLDIGTSLGGVIIIETLFGVTGLGWTVIQAINQQDEPVILGITILAATFVVVANLIVDILYAVLDPRVRLY